MKLPEERIRVVAAAPMEIGNRRLLPSVLVRTLERRWSDTGFFRSVTIRPVSIVVEDQDGATWHEIPNTTADTLSTMGAIAITIAAVSAVVIVLTHWLKRG